MKKILNFLFGFFFLASAALAQPGKPAPKLAANPAKPAAKPAAVKIPLKNLKDSASYALGFNVGQNLAQRYQDMDVNIIVQALKEAYASKPCQLDVEMGPMIVNNYIMDANKKVAAKNKELGAGFLQKNALKPGVITTASGLQYQVLREGKGDKPTPTDVVRVNYSGTLINGNQFDNSDKHGGPAQFSVGGVIAGWTEALQLMMPGSKYRLFVPSNLGYGDNQMGSDIPAGSTLIFEVELLEIVKQIPPQSEGVKPPDGQ
jgi:FKBP-type peptidyl-prolyl cis-trans isomerase FklB